VHNLGVPGKASFAVNGYSLKKNQNLSDTQQGAARFFTTVCSAFDFTLCSSTREIRASMLKTHWVI
jgi:hypothetical protein